MGKAFTCDRCGKFYKEKVKGKVTVMVTDDKGVLGTADLCADCTDTLEKWVKNDVYFVAFNDKEAADESEQTEE